MTWASYDGANPWTVYGSFDSADCETSEIGSAPFSDAETAGTGKHIVLSTGLVKEWISGTLPNNGLLLKMETDDMYALASVENTTPDHRPVLVIVYTLPFTMRGSLHANGCPD